MRDFDKQLMMRVNELFEGHNEFLEKFFPEMSVGELVLDMFNAGLIPNDIIESLLDE